MMAITSSIWPIAIGGVLLRPDDGGIDDQICEVRIIGNRLEDPPPDTLDRLKRRNTLFQFPNIR